MSFEGISLGRLVSKNRAPVSKPDSPPKREPLGDVLKGHTALKGSQQTEPEKPKEGSRQSAGASPAGITQEQRPSEQPSGVRREPPPPEAPTAPDRLPSTLSPATRKLAARVLPPSETWEKVNSDLKDALLVLSKLDLRQADAMPTAVTTAEGADATPIWDYVQQCVDDVMTRGPAVWGPWLDDLSRNPQTAPIVGRVLSMYTLNIYLTNAAIRQYIENPGGNTGTLNTEWFRSAHANTYNALKSVGDYIKINPQQGTLVKGIFNHQLQSFGGLPGRFGILLQECGLI